MPYGVCQLFPHILCPLCVSFRGRFLDAEGECVLILGGVNIGEAGWQGWRSSEDERCRIRDGRDNDRYEGITGSTQGLFGLYLATFSTVKESSGFAIGHLMCCGLDTSISSHPYSLSTTVRTACRSDVDDWRRTGRSLGTHIEGG